MKATATIRDALRAVRPLCNVEGADSIAVDVEEALHVLSRLEAEIRADERERVLAKVASFGTAGKAIAANIRERKS